MSRSLIPPSTPGYDHTHKTSLLVSFSTRHTPCSCGLSEDILRTANEQALFGGHVLFSAHLFCTLTPCDTHAFLRAAQAAPLVSVPTSTRETMAEDHHVRFASGTHLDPEPIHLLTSEEDPSLPAEAHVGILRTYHTYGIDIPIPHSLGSEVSARLATTNAIFTMVEPPATVKSKKTAAAEKYVTTVRLQMETVLEGDVAEKMELFVASEGKEPSESLEILLTAKVVRCNRGTPLLKDGVHVLSHQHSDNCSEWPGTYEENHVRFASGTHLDPEPIRLVQEDPSSPFPEAHMGILRNHHTYSVDIPIPHSLGPEVSAHHEPGNKSFTVMEPPTTVEVNAGVEKYLSTVKLQVKAATEGNIAETMKLIVAGELAEEPKSMGVLLTAKIIRCNQGNPLLKDGVHLVSHQHTDDCTVKEWPGTYEENRVRFASGTHLDPEPIRLAREDSTSLPPEAHVGILRNHHTYTVDIPIPHSMGPAVSACHHPDNTTFTVMEPPVTEGNTGADKYLSTVKLQVKTVAEGSIAEKMELFSAPSEGGGPSRSLEILLTAKVIRCNQGTPLLKDGVHVVCSEHTRECSEWPGLYEENHVRFASDTVLEPNPIQLTGGGDPSLPPEAHVGLLLNHHTYGVDIPVPHSLGPEVSARHASTNICFTVMEPPETVQSARGDDKYVSTVKLQIKTVKEGSIAEKVEVYVGEREGACKEVLLTAMVVKNNQGTPLLKDGVHVISRQRSEESDFTEWPGFSKESEEEMDN